MLRHARASQLFNIEVDYDQQYPIENKDLEDKYIHLLVQAMQAEHAPIEQYARLGLPAPPIG